MRRYFMVRRSAKAIGTIFYVPNDLEGLAFLKLMRKYLNRACHQIRLRGRNENRNGRRQDIPLSLSTYFAVYIDIAENSRKRIYREIRDIRTVLQNLKLEVFEHKESAAQLDGKLESLILQLSKPRKIQIGE